MERKRRRVLVVDDKEDSRYLLETLLKGAGHEVASARNGAEALEKLHTEEFDIIVTDILMPVMDGFRLCMHVKQDAGLCKIPLVFYSATYADEQDEDLALAMGAHKFIRKPVEPEEFARIISDVFAEISEREIPAGRPFMEKPEILFQRYNERVVNKLGQKLQELEQEIAERKQAEEALRDSEKRYKAVVENIDIGISLLNSNMEIVEINRVFREYFPHVRPGTGQICYEQYNDPPRSEPCSYCPCVLTLQDGEAHEAITETPAGPEIRNYHLVSSPIKDSDGRVQYVIELVEDITERKRAEETQRRLNRELQAVNSCNRVLMKAVDEQSLLNDICSIICETAGYRLAWVGYAEDDDAKTVRPVAWAGFDSGYIAETKLSWADDTERGRGPAGTAIRSREIVYVQDFATDPRMAPWRESALRRGYRSGIALPLKDEFAKVFGVLLIYATESNAITPEEVKLMEQLADDLAFGIVALRTRAQRKRAEEALDRANKEWERTFRTISDGIMVLDDQHGIVRANKAICDALGMAEPELIGKRCFELMHGEQEPPAFCPHAQLLADGEEHSAEVEEPRLAAILDVRVSPIRGQDGQVIGSVHVTRDITGRKQAEEALRQSEQRLRTVLDNVSLGVSLVDRNHNIIMVNHTFGKWFNKPPSDFVGKKCFREFENSKSICPHCPGVRSMATGKAAEVETEVTRIDGTPVSIRIRSFPIFGSDGTVTGFTEVVEDITEHKRAEQERESLRGQLLHAQKMESIGTLAGGIAHDFNNILTVVLGFSELLLAGRDERDPAHADLQKIREAAGNGAELVKRILAFSRKAEINLRPLDLNREIGQVKKLLARTIPKMIEIELALSPELSTVNADPVQIEQVLMNLAVNARDAMPDGGKLTIETKDVVLDEQYCRTHLGAKPGDHVLLSVSDTGQGMDKETLNRIFEPFYTTKEMGRGTGLGLAIVYGIVEQHGGFITCSSEVGTGTRFEIHFPALPAEDISKAPERKPALQRGTETILLVDDEEAVRILGTRILERFGYTVLVAADGKEALDLYIREKDRISLVILDLIMPGTGGRECFRNLLAVNPMVKVIIASGYTSAGTVKDAIEIGALSFVPKPYDTEHLLTVVREALNAR